MRTGRDAAAGIELRAAEYSSDRELLTRVRFAVFVDEQGVAPEIELDERDPHCIHIVAIERGSPVGTGRIDLERAGKIGRVAVLGSHRRRGIGRALMAALHEIAVLHDLETVWCHAQVSASAFYETLGYEVTGEPFDEAGIPHRRMRKSLAGEST